MELALCRMGYDGAERSVGVTALPQYVSVARWSRQNLEADP